MRKHIVSGLLLSVIFVLSGCTSAASPPDAGSSSAPVETSSVAMPQDAAANSANSGLVTMKVSGGFVATVEELPEKSYSGKIVMLSTYQSIPFILHMSKFGRNITSEDSEPFSLMEEGKSYYFEVEERTFADIPRAVYEFYRGNPRLILLTQSLDVIIESIREPKEEEYGVESWKVLIEEV